MANNEGMGQTPDGAGRERAERYLQEKVAADVGDSYAPPWAPGMQVTSSDNDGRGEIRRLWRNQADLTDLSLRHEEQITRLEGLTWALVAATVAEILALVLLAAVVLW